MTLWEAEALSLSELEHVFVEAMAWQKFVDKARAKRSRKG